ncbi:hypothetical protein IWW34DRAFT_826050 [Fusarium oxysporum f. sp. albedinis]|uniref:Uncharacterized protein n=3 Tax=Fusarium oxysporum TaxID=5507 RepID=A0A8H5EK35_FUSOX|nr:uncharacterized protein FOBCDRAFT_315576 [Fusarium oxysporum Fo47]KAF5263538.1 hypothetical protein FOXYS1_5717 [Fusarium oxysporum]KAH7486217.1 hypothetical protein FOMA001_g4935 [Fusarium oxysporum f. sp. matthiolae]KAI3588072.1 hypothetical protein IWW34DRAFT_826050 [Fusarium oxysporum f. sp. albedinis]RKK25092.1 hypothetical protein BFJ65_g3005 [Fusarium oxysporum f. sp. cepae]EWZ47371.1 hypothetical protein FOZG_03307 [Fusarium oxysporum Fo47]
MAESVSTVELGDEIAVEVSDKSKSIPVTFSQDRHEKTVDYYSGTFTNASRSKTGVFFVQVDFLPKLLERFPTKVVKIDNTFQYGQKDKTGANRWVVFHDTALKPFQHRFAESLGRAYQFSQAALEIISKMGFTPGVDVGKFFEGLRGAIGHYLRTFGEK